MVSLARSKFNSLEGKWNFTRIIEDKITNTRNNIEGTCVFIKLDSDIYQYDESGIIELNFKEYPFTRSYIYHFVNDGVDIIFNDGLSKGQIFNRLDFNVDNCSDSHICNLDKHFSEYQFISDFEFDIKHTVVGPVVNYISFTSFTKKS